MEEIEVPLDELRRQCLCALLHVKASTIARDPQSVTLHTTGQDHQRLVSQSIAAIVLQLAILPKDMTEPPSHVQGVLQLSEALHLE